MSGQDSSATTIGNYDAKSPYRDDDALDDDPGVTGTDSLSSKARASTWTGSPYEPLPSEPGTSYSASTFGDYDTGLAISRPTTFAPTETDADDAPLPTTGRRTKSRAIAGLISGVLGLAMMAGGLYLLGEFGFRVYDAMINELGQPSAWDIAFTATGAGLLFIAAVLNGWSPWATLLPGLALTAAGIWSLATYDGADRVATFVDGVFGRPEMVLWGITGWMLALGLVLIGTSLAAVIARAAGRRRARR
jgi:hypothetical protein